MRPYRVGRRRRNLPAREQETSAASVPPITPLPDAAVVPDSATSRDELGRHAGSAATRLPVDTELIPGRVVEPIDLANALRLTGARNLDIAVARQQILAATADLTAARALWLPSLFYGPTWYRSDGQIQTVTGQVQTINRSALFVGGTAALNNTIQGPPPGTGIPSVNGTTATLRISDAIFTPMAARRVLTANQAGLRTATNDAMLQIAEAYFDLQGATGRLAIAREAAANAEALSAITSSYAKLGQGLEADHRRALTEVKHRRRDAQLASGQLLVASANLIRLLVLDPKIVMVPIEPPECIIHLIPDDIPLDDLVIQGLQNRPELASAQDLVQAAVVRRQAGGLRPFIPSVFMTYAGGGLGGGANAFFGNFGPRGDAEVGLFWELQNLGFTDVAIMRRRAAELEISNLEKIRTQTQVGADIVASFETRLAAARQIEDARETLVEAIESLRLNFVNIRQGAAAATRHSPHRGLAADPGAGPGPPRLPRFGPVLQPRPVPAQTRHRPGAVDLAGQLTLSPWRPAETERCTARPRQIGRGRNKTADGHGSGAILSALPGPPRS